jgi:putative PEP-CTERM system TPR-repeat lipoprotein
VKFWLTLGALYLRAGDAVHAEQAFLEARTRDPKSVEAHSVLADLYLGKRDMVQAERELKAAAELAPAGSLARVRLADFYLLTRRPDEAKRTLLDLTRTAPDTLPAWRRLAEISLGEGKYDEALTTLRVLLKKNPADLDGHFLMGRLRLAKREPTEAIQEFQQVLKLEARHAPAFFQLALANLQLNNEHQAKANLTQAASLAPNFSEAVLLLAQLNLKAGAVQPAIDDLQRLVARQAAMVDARLLLGSAYLAKRDAVKAIPEFQKVIELAPTDARGPYMVGVALRVQARPAEAKKAFEQALASAPDYVEPLAQLVAMSLLERQPDVALARITKQIAVRPRSGGFQHLLGVVHLNRREPELAERAFLKAIELDANLVDAYVQLSKIYGASRRYDEALAKANTALAIEPRNLAVQMLVGTLYEGNDDLTKAKEAYEKALVINPSFAPAANNLAYLYSEHGGDAARALELAQRAKEAAPDDPWIADTLGWILYKRGVYQQAFGLLRESVGKLPGNPVIQYHFGMAALKVGDKEAARKALIAASSAAGSYTWREEARKTLADLN